MYFPGRDFPTQSPAGDYKEVPCHHVRIPYASKGRCLDCPCSAVQRVEGRVPEQEPAHWIKQAPNSGRLLGAVQWKIPSFYLGESPKSSLALERQVLATLVVPLIF